MVREEITVPSWPAYRQASVQINAGALADAGYRKQQATLPAIFRISNNERRRPRATVGASCARNPM